MEMILMFKNVFVNFSLFLYLINKNKTKLESFETFIEFILFIIGINKTYNRMDTRNKKNPIAGYMGYVPSR